MKNNSLVVGVLSVLIAFGAIAEQKGKNIFQGTIGGETYRGYFDGQCGIWQKDFNSMLQIEDSNGLSRELFTAKIDFVELNPVPDKTPEIVVGIGDKRIKGTFPCMTFLITDTGKIDLLSSKLNKKVTLTRVR